MRRWSWRGTPSGYRTASYHSMWLPQCMERGAGVATRPFLRAARRSRASCSPTRTSPDRIRVEKSRRGRRTGGPRLGPDPSADAARSAEPAGPGPGHPVGEAGAVPRHRRSPARMAPKARSGRPRRSTTGSQTRSPTRPPNPPRTTCSVPRCRRSARGTRRHPDHTEQLRPSPPRHAVLTAHRGCVATNPLAMCLNDIPISSATGMSTSSPAWTRPLSTDPPARRFRAPRIPACLLRLSRLPHRARV